MKPAFDLTSLAPLMFEGYGDGELMVITAEIPELRGRWVTVRMAPPAALLAAAIIQNLPVVMRPHAASDLPEPELVPVEEILGGGQEEVSEFGLSYYLKGGEAAPETSMHGNSLPIYARDHTGYWIIDGNHRSVVAKLRRDEHILAHVFDMRDQLSKRLDDTNTKGA